MGNQEDLNKIELTELIDMCNLKPQNVTLSNRVISDGYRDFNLESDKEIKVFIGGGNLEEPFFAGCSPSDQIQDVMITAYKFRSGTKHGYLAYHRKANDVSKIHIKSFHKDEHHPKTSVATLASVFAKLLGGEKSE